MEDVTQNAVSTLSDRRDRLAAALVELAGADVTPAGMARAAAELLGFDDAAITVGATGGGVYLVGVRGPLAAGMEDVQRRLGEGPTLAAMARNSPVIAATTEGSLSRWPAFDARAIDAGITFVLALPLHPRREPPSALSLYDTSPAPVDEDRIGDVLLVADMIAEALTDPSAEGLLQRLAQVGEDSSAVHQATGIIAARRSLSPAEALSSLRAEAASSGTSVRSLAARIAADHDQAEKRLWPPCQGPS